jgi:hypothetical protein
LLHCVRKYGFRVFYRLFGYQPVFNDHPDNADPDKDGDGWTDEEERKAGTDPLDKLSFPVKVMGLQEAALLSRVPCAEFNATRVALNSALGKPPC